MYRSSPFRSTLNTGYITGLGMCKVCTEAVHCVAFSTRTSVKNAKTLPRFWARWQKLDSNFGAPQFHQMLYMCLNLIQLSYHTNSKHENLSVTTQHPSLPLVQSQLQSVCICLNPIIQIHTTSTNVVT